MLGPGCMVRHPSGVRWHSPHARDVTAGASWPTASCATPRARALTATKPATPSDSFADGANGKHPRRRSWYRRVRGPCERKRRVVEWLGRPEQSKSGRVSTTDLLLLGVLMRRPSHGYEIAEFFADPAMDHWVVVAKTSLYYSLGRLNREGLVNCHAERQGGRPQRSVYTITDLGRRTFYDGLQQALREPLYSVDPLDVALFFSEHLATDVLIPLLRERRAGLDLAHARIEGALAAARIEGEGHSQQGLVLEHRLTVTRSRSTYISELMESLGREVPNENTTLSGSLDQSALLGILKNIAGARRTGELSLEVNGRTARFRFVVGEVRAVATGSEEGDSEGLPALFAARAGAFRFSPTIREDAPWVPVDGLLSVILMGCRGVTDNATIQRMGHEPATIFDLREGYQFEAVGLDLTETERAVLHEIDGARTLGEIARRLDMSSEKTAAEIFPLWAIDWVTITGRAKREVGEAIAAYLSLWKQAISAVAGTDAAEQVRAEVEIVAELADIPDLLQAALSPGSIRLPGTRDQLGTAGREYCRMFRKAVATRLGSGFLADAQLGIAARLDARYVVVVDEFDLDGRHGAPIGGRGQ